MNLKSQVTLIPVSDAIPSRRTIILSRKWIRSIILSWFAGWVSWWKEFFNRQPLPDTCPFTEIIAKPAKPRLFQAGKFLSTYFFRKLKMANVFIFAVYMYLNAFRKSWTVKRSFAWSMPLSTIFRTFASPSSRCAEDTVNLNKAKIFIKEDFGGPWAKLIRLKAPTIQHPRPGKDGRPITDMMVNTKVRI